MGMYPIPNFWVVKLSTYEFNKFPPMLLQCRYPKTGLWVLPVPPLLMIMKGGKQQVENGNLVVPWNQHHVKSGCEKNHTYTYDHYRAQYVWTLSGTLHPRFGVPNFFRSDSKLFEVYVIVRQYLPTITSKAKFGIQQS